MRKIFPTLYKISSKGQEIQWTITVDGDSFYSEDGIVGGKITVSAPTVCEPKNEGRANATNPKEQALMEAEAKWDKKLKSGYFKTIKEAKSSDFFRPMKGDNFKDREDEFEYPVFSSAKLDGIRCPAKLGGLFSSEGNLFVSCPHIFEALEPTFLKIPDLTIDGELYNHKFKDDFNEIVSLIKRPKPTAEDLQRTKKYVELWVFDITSPELGKLPFTERYAWINKKLKDISPHIKILDQTICRNREELDKKYEEYLDDGFEGQMVRWGDVGYQNKRCKYILKRKEWITEEFEIVDILEGKGGRAGMAGKALVRLSNGETCKTGVKGKTNWFKKILKERKEIVGKMGTVKFKNYTPDGALRHAHLIAIRDYE
jgi:DNA ligase 1